MKTKLQQIDKIKQSLSRVPKKDPRLEAAEFKYMESKMNESKGNKIFAALRAKKTIQDYKSSRALKKLSYETGRASSKYAVRTTKPY